MILMNEKLIIVIFIVLISLLIWLCVKNPTFDRIFCLFISILTIGIVLIKIKYKNKLYKLHK